MDDSTLLWEEYIKNIKPIKNNQQVNNIPMLNISKSKLKEISNARSDYYYAESINRVFNGTLNEEVLKKIDAKEIIIEAFVDLHNKTVDDARNIFIDFIQDCYKTKKRYVLVITGKGNKNISQHDLKHRSDAKENMGILYNEFYLWVKEPLLKSMIVTFSHSNKRHGGSGAFYVLIKKNNNIFKT